LPSLRTISAKSFPLVVRLAYQRRFRSGTGVSPVSFWGWMQSETHRRDARATVVRIAARSSISVGEGPVLTACFPSDTGAKSSHAGPVGL
jgi:hypothetical protein